MAPSIDIPSVRSSTHTRRRSTASSWRSCRDFGLCFSATCSANERTLPADAFSA